ncbi:MAG: hypothetical protein ACRD13_14245 [Terriglobales bacterium]
MDIEPTDRQGPDRAQLARRANLPSARAYPGAQLITSREGHLYLTPGCGHD